jgi:hypothetical protein
MPQPLRRLGAILLALALSACTLTAPAPTPMPTPDLPQVRFLFPENGTQIYAGAEINVDILAEDATLGIARIEFYVDGVKINEGSPVVVTSPFRVTMNWVANSAGGHTLKAVAYRTDGTPSPEAPGGNLILVDVIPAP